MANMQGTRFTLAELLNAANQHYDEGYLSSYFDVTTGGRKAGSGDTLAEFIVCELRENFDRQSPRGRQLATAVRVLERAKKDIQNAIVGLRQLGTPSRLNLDRDRARRRSHH